MQRRAPACSGEPWPLKGFVLVAIEIWRIQHHVFGTPRMLVRLRDWTRRRLGKEGEMHHLKVADALTMTDTASLRAQRGKATSLEGYRDVGEAA